MDTAPETVAFPKGEDAWTQAQADALLRVVEDIFHRRDIDALVAGFTEDCVVRFSEQPEFTGREALRALFAARFARQKNYRLRKTNRMLKGNMLGNVWTGSWEDSETGARKEGFGVEFWTMKDGIIAVWEASFSVWDADGERKSAVM